jgi:hypothetical protein
VGDLLELVVLGAVVALLVRVRFPSRFPALQLGVAIAVTVAVGRPLVDSGFRGALVAALAGAAAALLIARARPASGTGAPDRADTSASR